MTPARQILILFVMSHVLCLAQNGAPGTISGTVVNDTGKPVSGAKLICQRLTEYKRGSGQHLVVNEFGTHVTVFTGADGKFIFSGLPGGRYDLCAYGSQNQVSACEWKGSPVLQLESGGSLTGVTRMVLEGSVITMRVADPNGKIAVPQANGKIPPERRFFIGVSAGLGHYHRAEAISHGPAQHMFRVTIPKQMSIRLFIDSDLVVLDSTGKRLGTKAATDFQLVPLGRDALDIDLAVQ